MDNDTLLSRACQSVDCAVTDVLAHRVYEDRIVLIVNRGGAGCPEYNIPLSELPQQEPQPVEAAPKTAAPKKPKRARRKPKKSRGTAKESN